MKKLVFLLFFAHAVSAQFIGQPRRGASPAAVGAISERASIGTPFVTPQELRLGKADLAEAVNVISNGRIFRYRYNSTSVAADDSSAFLRFGTRVYQLDENIITPEAFLAVGDGVADDTYQIQKAINYVGTIRGILWIPGGKKYLIDSVIVNSNYVMIRGLAGGLNRFGTASNADAGAIFIHKAGSTKTMITLNKAGAVLEDLYFNGNSAPGTILKIAHGFENRMRNVRLAYGGGVGWHIEGSYNTYYENIFVDNCGSTTKAAVLLQTAPPRTINTCDFYGLTIERSQGVALDINSATNGDIVYPETVRFFGLHIENPADNGGIANTQPLINAGNFRGVDIIGAFMVGGPGKFIVHNQTEGTLVTAMGGLKITGGSFWGRNFETGDQPDTLIHLIRGNAFSITGAEFDNTLTGTSSIVIESTYSAEANIGQITRKRIGATLLADNRTTKNYLFFDGPVRIMGDLVASGHIKGSNSVTTLTSVANSAAGTGRPSPVVTGNDVRGQITFGTGTSPTSGAMVTVTFNKVYTTTPKAVIFQAKNSATSALGTTWAGKTTTGFTLYVPTAPTASQANTVYDYDYLVIE